MPKRTQLALSLKSGKAAPTSPRHDKRQLDKISNGSQGIGHVSGIGGETSALTTALDEIDGSST
ncbi:hypothetical protein NX059_001364 [Plenodomus lindquistii]|nr:hypothetical protein NX059_001364 [Plenodomus lindquistii]